MKARIVTVCQAGHTSDTVEKNREHVLGLLDLALSQKPDLVCLPETFTTASLPPESIWDSAEPLPGPTTEAVAERAKAGSCYVICPILTKRESKLWNSAVVVDRSGGIAGVYDKAHPVTSSPDYTVFENGVTPGREIPVFDLDLGRIGIQICFDAGFPESWAELGRKGAKMVFWPSAYNGGFPLQAYAYLHHYYVVSSVRAEKSRIIDPCGVILAETDPFSNIIWRDINLDFMVAHYDFNLGILDGVMKAYNDRVEIRSHRDDAHFLVEPRDDALTMRQLKESLGFESTFTYHQRHRDAYEFIHQGKRPVAQKAAHGNRPMHSK